jgi:prophage DNA circulation protein
MSVLDSMATIQRASADLYRRVAVVAVCRAAARYQPSSYDDAVVVWTTVTGLLDAEIQIAGDQGEDATYNALRSLRAAVVQDLTARGADLSVLTTITSPRPMPALTLAQRVYRDASRAGELVTEAGPSCIHPCFMPTSFRGLAQ